MNADDVRAGARGRHEPAVLVAVVSDGTAHNIGPHSRPLDLALADDADLLADLGRIYATPLVIEPGEADELAATLHRLPDDVAAVFLTRTTFTRSRVAQRRLLQLGGRPMLTAEDATAVTLAAATLAYLLRIGRDPGTARVLVVGAVGMPTLALLLFSTGIGDISLWNRSDQHWFPLRHAVRDADVVIDLLRDHTLDELAHDRPEGSVIPAISLDARAVAAPGILRALTHYPLGTVQLGIEHYRDCALAASTATPGRVRWPGFLRDHGITDAVEAAVHDRVGSERRAVMRRRD